MKVKFFLLGVVSLLLASCSNELEQLLNESGECISNLSINVLTDQVESKGTITGTYLPASSNIGVTVTNTSEGNYDGTAYNNIKFTSTGTGSSQTWAGASTVKLSATDGYCYAYYPYSSSVTDITSIPVSTSGQSDYMYATKVTVNDKAKNATLAMKHALSAIRFALKKGTYAGAGAVTAVSVKSSGIGTSAKLNAKTGALSSVSGTNTAISVSKSLTLSTTAQNVDVIGIPSGTAATLTLSVTIDGKSYSTTVSSTTIAQASCYTYTLTVNAGNLALSGVTVGAWGYNSAGTPTITAAGYTVTFAGNYSDLTFQNTVSDNTLTIVASSAHIENTAPKAVTATNCTVSQQYDSSAGTRTIVLSSLTSNVTVTFDGYGSLSTYTKDFYNAGSGTWTVPDGVTQVEVFLVGGGGGGASLNYTGSPASFYAGAGGGSGYTKTYASDMKIGNSWPTAAKKVGRDGGPLSVTPGQSITYVVGRGGSGGQSGSTSAYGNAGTATSFGSLSASGGEPGQVNYYQRQTGQYQYTYTFNCRGGNGGSGGSCGSSGAYGGRDGANGSSGGSGQSYEVQQSGVFWTYNYVLSVTVGTGQGHTTNCFGEGGFVYADGGGVYSSSSIYGSGGTAGGSGIAGYIQIRYKTF